MKNLEDRFRQGRQLGAPLQLLDADEAERRTGSPAFHGALFDPRAGTIQPLLYCQGLAEAADRAGAQVFEASGVESLEYIDGAWLARTNGGTVRAKHLLLATNAYGPALSGVAMPEFVTVSYSQFATAPIPDTQRRHILPGGEGCWDTATVMSSVRLDADGRMIIGGIGNLEGPAGSVHEGWARRKLSRLYPQLSDMKFEYSWRGEIAMTSDHIPKLLRFGPVALSVFGYSGRGIAPGSLLGKCAARALLLVRRNNYRFRS